MWTWRGSSASAASLALDGNAVRNAGGKGPPAHLDPGDAGAADIVDAPHLDRQARSPRLEPHEFGPDAEFDPLPGGEGAIGPLQGDRCRLPMKAVAPSTRQGRMFMPGEPMKWPTKVWAGRSNSSSGVPVCTTAPSCMTTTLSAKVSASVWSCVT